MADHADLATEMTERVLEESLSQRKQVRHWTVVAWQDGKESVISFDAATLAEKEAMMAAAGIDWERDRWAGGYQEPDGGITTCGDDSLKPAVERAISQGTRKGAATDGKARA